ncbi:MAG: hypothetical protein NTZ05_07150, partial [Chloroflexi bacterium]|nr:hypothetical protein [Chloroflexota bacterium]
MGNNTTTTSNRAVQVLAPGGSGVFTGGAVVAASVFHSVAAKNDGTVWAWGFNGNGQLGINSTTTGLTPAQVLGVGGVDTLTGVATVAAGQNNSLALKSDGTVWAWGNNSGGQLGDTTTTQRNAPVQVVGVGGSGFLTDAFAIATGTAHVLAVTATP